MSKPTRVPPDFEFPPSLPEGRSGFDSLVKHEPRGGAVDHDAIVKGAPNVPPLPGASEMNVHEAYRQRLIAGVRANEGRIVNGAARGGLFGAFLGFFGSLFIVLVSGAGKRRRK
jgi:hypothetical protein